MVDNRGSAMILDVSLPMILLLKKRYHDYPAPAAMRKKPGARRPSPLYDPRELTEWAERNPLAFKKTESRFNKHQRVKKRTAAADSENSSREFEHTPATLFISGHYSPDKPRG